MQGKLSNTVKWSTFCVSFVLMLTIFFVFFVCVFCYVILPERQHQPGITSKVRFGMVSINPVTNYAVLPTAVETSAETLLMRMPNS